MYLLSLDTSTKIFSLSLSQDGKVLRYRNLKSAAILEDVLIPTMDKLLDLAGILFDDIDVFAVGLGPGSFTSLRVGLSSVKAFAFARRKPVIGIPSLDIIAQAFTFETFDQIVVITDARRGKIYACIYGPQGRLSGYLLTTIDELLINLKGRTLFAGDALLVYRTQIDEAYKKYNETKAGFCTCFFADQKDWYPKPQVMANMAYERAKVEAYDEPQSLLPLYLYAQDCQVSR